MNPKTVQVLSDLIGFADRLQREYDAATLRPCARDLEILTRLTVDVSRALKEPVDGERVIDEAAQLLLQTCTLLCREAGTPGKQEKASRFAAIMLLFLPHVRTDLAHAMGVASRPATSEQDYAGHR